MAKNKSNSNASELPPPPKVGRLTTISAIRRELASLYKDARQGRASANEASKLAYILRTLGDVIKECQQEEGQSNDGFSRLCDMLERTRRERE